MKIQKTRVEAKNMIGNMVWKKSAAVKSGLQETTRTLGNVFQLGLAAMGLFDTTELNQELGNWENWTGIA